MNAQEQWKAVADKCPVTPKGSPQWAVWMRQACRNHQLYGDSFDRYTLDQVCAFAIKTSMTTSFTPAKIPHGTKVIDGETHIRNSKGGWDLLANVKDQHLAEDKIVRKVAGYWLAANEQISRLKVHTMDDVDAHEAYLADQYDAKLGGAKGNKTLKTVDGLIEVKVRINDVIDFGPELQIAKSIVDECINEWAEGSSREIRAIIANAFHTDQEGKVNRTEIIRLKRLPIVDKRWERAMDAIKDAERSVSSKAYIYCRMREDHTALWKSITIDMAKA